MSETSEGGAGQRRVWIAWLDVIADHELVALTLDLGRSAQPGWWDRVRPHSLGWASARDRHGRLVGFVNVAWDGANHAFLLDTKVTPEHQRHGLATRLVTLAVDRARQAGCEWLHVDFEERLSEFYLRACGFAATKAGLIYLQ